jgi:DNA-binding response OmpR family regulator
MAARLLVVDDDRINRRLLVAHLERQGHDVTTAADGQEGWERVLAERFDVVLLDVQMPRVDGYELLRWIRAEATLRHLPVIMISSIDELDSIVRCIELGADDYLPKPFDPTLLRARIGAGLVRKRLHDLEREYAEQVGQVGDAAAAVEAGRFEPESLAAVAGRDDALGTLARLFQRMAREVAAREQALRREVLELRIEIDQARAERRVADIVDSDRFDDLRERARALRGRR